MHLALFDLDNTLLAGDSDFEWAQFLIEEGVLHPDEYHPKNQWFFERYKDGTLDIHEFLDFQLKPLARHDRAVLDAWHREFMARKIIPIITDSARDLVRRHTGDVCAIVTATNSFVTAPIARAFGIEHLIATEPEEKEGQFTGRVRGTPSFREGKVERVLAWLAQRGQSFGAFDRSWFYSDSLNDLPLLSQVTDPVAVDPDAKLLAHAGRNVWPVLRLHTA
jgi:HAD superfamily hydrolase (TIGR01490 family)